MAHMGVSRILLRTALSSQRVTIHPPNGRMSSNSQILIRIFTTSQPQLPFHFQLKITIQIMLLKYTISSSLSTPPLSSRINSLHLRLHMLNMFLRLSLHYQMLLLLRHGEVHRLRLNHHIMVVDEVADVAGVTVVVWKPR
jgi:hypothetical protein